MLERNQRKIQFYNFSLTSTPHQFEFIGTDVFHKILFAFKNNEAKYIVGTGRACIRIQDVITDNNNKTISFLINYSDKNLSNPGMQKIHSNELRLVEGEYDEALTHSLHISICFEQDFIGNYLGVVEYIPGFSKSIYISIFNKIFKNRCYATIPHPQTNRDVKCWPKLESCILESDDFRKALEGHPLRGVDLIRHDINDIDIDKGYEYEIKKQVVMLKPKYKIFGKNALEFVKTCAGIGKSKKYPYIQVYFKNEQGNDASLTAGTTNFDVNELFFGKKVDIRTQQDIEQCSESIHFELNRQMKKALLQEKNRLNEKYT